MANNADWANKDFYKVLGVAKDAEPAAIKKAYRKLARANHPDSRPGDQAAEDRFKQVAEAYDVVGDAEKRKQYDEMRTMFAGAGAGGGFGGFPGGFGGQTSGGSGGFDVSDLFGDLFNQGGGRSTGFGNRNRAPRPAKGADIETETSLDFRSAVDGTTISMRLRSDAPCPTCSGTGGKPGTRPHICGTSDRTVSARIPAGVKDGQRIRLKGKGAAGENGGPNGDLLVTVHVKPHQLFGRKADNLTLEAPVTFDEAALGAEIKVPTLDGAPVTLRIAPGTPNGRVLRVRGRGAPRKDGSKGDLLVTVA